MALDYLQTLTAVLESWEAANALLRQRINAALRQRGARPKLSTKKNVPAGLTLNAAIRHLRAAVHRLRSFPVDADRVPWLAVTQPWWALPVNSEADADYQLSKLPASKDVDPDFWEREVVAPQEQRANAIRVWLKTEAKQAMATALSKRQWKILKALHKLQAFGPDSRVNAAEIVKRAKDEDADPGVYKHPIADLVKKGLVETRQGHTGGCWLTREGRTLVASIPAK
jgi:hypothetical protein